MPEQHGRQGLQLIASLFSRGNFPVTFANLIAGGFHSVDTIEERDNIPQEDPEDPLFRREGMYCYVSETETVYQLVGGISNDHWEVADLDDYKDIVFMLGHSLQEGPQDQSEIWVPYKGTIQTVFATVGMESNHTSNLIFSIQKWDEEANDGDGEWSSEQTYELKVEDRKKEFATMIPVDHEKARINLVSGDFEQVHNMSVIARLEIG